MRDMSFVVTRSVVSGVKISHLGYEALRNGDGPGPDGADGGIQAVPLVIDSSIEMKVTGESCGAESRAGLSWVEKQYRFRYRRSCTSDRFFRSHVVALCFVKWYHCII